MILKVMKDEVGHFVTKQSQTILAVAVLKTRKSLVGSYLVSVVLTMQGDFSRIRMCCLST